MTTHRFRPGGNVKWLPRHRLTMFPTVYNIGSQLHYLAQHAPKPIQRRWLLAWQRFTAHYRKF
jgi:hypothetical protein